MGKWSRLNRSFAYELNLPTFLGPAVLASSPGGKLASPSLFAAFPMWPSPSLCFARPSAHALACMLLMYSKILRSSYTTSPCAGPYIALHELQDPIYCMYPTLLKNE